MTPEALTPRHGDVGDQEQDDFWTEVYWIAQFLSLPGFALGYFWIAMAYSSQHNGTNADNVHVVGGLGWELGAVPVIAATGLMTLLLLFLGWKASKVAGSARALALQIVLSAVLYGLLISTDVLYL